MSPTAGRHGVAHHSGQTRGLARVSDHFKATNGRHCVIGRDRSASLRRDCLIIHPQARTFISLPAGVGPLKEFIGSARHALQTAKQTPIAMRDAIATKVLAQVESAMGPRAFAILQSSASKLGSINPAILLNPMPHIASASNKTRAFVFRHKNAIYTVGQGFAVVGVWHGTLYVTSVFTDITDSSSEFAALGFATVVVLVSTAILKQRTRIDVDNAHALLLRRIDSHAGLKEVLGVPIVNRMGNARVALVTGGEWRRDCFDVEAGRKKNETKRSWLPALFANSGSASTKWRWRDERAHLCFPVSGSRAGGFVTAECVKRAGKKLQFDLVAVDVFSQNGDSHRVFLSGGSLERENADDMITALRVPLDVALDDSYDEQRARDAAELEETLRLQKQLEFESRVPKPLDHGGGMWPSERVLDTAGAAAHNAKSVWSAIRKTVSRG